MINLTNRKLHTISAIIGLLAGTLTLLGHIGVLTIGNVPIIGQFPIIILSSVTILLGYFLLTKK